MSKRLFKRGKPIHVPQLYKAQSIGGRIAPDLNLTATAELPDVDPSTDESVWRPAHYRQFDEQADIIFRALIDSMPGGTIDALLIRLLQHRRGTLVVTYPQDDIASALAAWLAVERTPAEKEGLLRNVAADLGLSGVQA